MRVSLETKVATRQRILDVAARLFAAGGWEHTTTRDIAADANIATGTLFNYFPSKEAIVASLISLALTEAREEFAERRRGEESLEEDLFSFIWTGLKRLELSRKFLGPALETLLSPLARFSPDHAGDSIRTEHLEIVEQLIVSHGIPGPLSAVTMQLYWTLYLGVLAYWTADASPKQEDTLALLDQSLKLFVASLSNESSQTADSRNEKETTNDTQGE
ncbi:MAG: TetR family transcriptional regulator [Candidatus Acidiferrales bacterium]